MSSFVTSYIIVLSQSAFYHSEMVLRPKIEFGFIQSIYVDLKIHAINVCFVLTQMCLVML